MHVESVTRLERMYEILSLCRAPTQKTHILHECSLSHRQLSKYLNFLDHNILLEYFSEDRVYQVTKKGRRFIEEYRRVKKALEQTSSFCLGSARPNSTDDKEKSLSGGYLG